MSEKNITNEQVKRNQLTHEQTTRIIRLLGGILCFIIAFGLAFTPVWQLAFLAGIIGGLFFTEMEKGVVVGLLGVGLGWSGYIVIQIMQSNVMTLIDQVTGIILGNESLGWLIVLIIILVGIILGALGGTLGSGIRKLVKLRRTTQES